VVGERAGGRPLCIADTGFSAPVVERTNASESVMHIRVYHSTWLLTGGHELRPPLLAGEHIDIPDAVGRYQDVLARGELDAIVACFEEDGYFREPSGGDFVYRGKDALREAYAFLFSNGGGIPLEHWTLTDDGTHCAIEYNVVRWGNTELPPQSGVAVYERGRSGLLAAARVYDDVDAPLG
jgi:SnoaL-like domain